MIQQQQHGGFLLHTLAKVSVAHGYFSTGWFRGLLPTMARDVIYTTGETACLTSKRTNLITILMLTMCVIHLHAHV